MANQREIYDVSTLPSSTKKKIATSSYYHLKHYGEFNDYTELSWNEYINRMSKIKINGMNFLDTLIQQQEQRELTKLSQLFNGLINVDLNNPHLSNSLKMFITLYNKGVNNINIDTGVEILNQLVHIDSDNSQSIQELTDAANQAKQILSDVFNDRGLNTAAFNISTLQGQRDIITNLEQVRDKLQLYIQSNDLFSEIMQKPINKLNAAIKYYSSIYQKNYEKDDINYNEIQQKINNISEYLTANNSQVNWNNHKKSKKYSEVQTTLLESIKGFTNWKKGQLNEDAIGEQMIYNLKDAFAQSITLDLVTGATTVTGKQKDDFNKFQKADVTLDFTSTGFDDSIDNFNLSFSLKRHDSSGNIGMHGGGSLFAYIPRFQQMANNLGVDIGLNDVFYGNVDLGTNNSFFYHYANNLDEGNTILKAFKEMLQGIGFLFFGEEISQNQNLSTGAADFFVYNERIVSFSSILKDVRNNPNLIHVEVGLTNAQTPKSAKANLYETDDRSQQYDDTFVNESISIGRRAIRGTNFQISISNSSFHG